jgi:hypothetical protein
MNLLMFSFASSFSFSRLIPCIIVSIVSEIEIITFLDYKKGLKHVFLLIETKKSLMPSRL